MASEMLIILTKRVETAEKQSVNGDKVNWNSAVEVWKHQNFRISKLVDNINYFFGPLLVLMITFCFIMTINTSFNLMMGVRENIASVGNVIHVFVLFITFSWFFLVIYIPHRLRPSV